MPKYQPSKYLPLYEAVVVIVILSSTKLSIVKVSIKLPYITSSLISSPLYFTPYEQVKKDADKIDEYKYYTPIPIHIRNNFVQIVKKMPKTINLATMDNDKFMKRKDIEFAKTLKELNFLSSNDQFDKKLERDKQMFIGSREDIKDYTVKEHCMSQKQKILSHLNPTQKTFPSMRPSLC